MNRFKEKISYTNKKLRLITVVSETAIACLNSDCEYLEINNNILGELELFVKITTDAILNSDISIDKIELIKKGLLSFNIKDLHFIMEKYTVDDRILNLLITFMSF